MERGKSAYSAYGRAFRVYFILAGALVTLPGTALSIPLSVPVQNNSDSAVKESVVRDPPGHDERYIIDVDGKRVRIIGDRFYGNPTKTLTFPGRTIPAR